MSKDKDRKMMMYFSKNLMQVLGLLKKKRLRKNHFKQASHLKEIFPYVKIPHHFYNAYLHGQGGSSFKNG